MPRSANAQLLELIGETQGLLELAELREGLLAALHRIVPSDWISINEIGSSPNDVYVVVRPALPKRMHKTFAKHAHENPLIARFARTGDTRPYRFSDVISRRELHALALYQECYAELGLEHQIAFIIKVSETSHVAIALSRKARNYTNTERTLLDRARPYLIQIYHNAIAHTALLTAHSEPPTAAMTAGLLDNGLTPAETDVRTHVAHGQSNADIAAELNVSERTSGKHLQRSYHKLGVTNRSQAATLAWTISQPPKASP
jgi:DNA-binding NarL/FixJ family response regulator